VHKTVGYPGEKIQDDVLLSREDVAQVGAIHDVLESGQDAHPDGRAVLGGDVSTMAESAVLRNGLCGFRAAPHGPRFKAACANGAGDRQEWDHVLAGWE
jgi:hypothetical protein